MVMPWVRLLPQVRSMRCATLEHRIYDCAVCSDLYSINQFLHPNFSSGHEWCHSPPKIAPHPSTTLPIESVHQGKIVPQSRALVLCNVLSLSNECNTHLRVRLAPSLIDTQLQWRCASVDRPVCAILGCC